MTANKETSFPSTVALFAALYPQSPPVSASSVSKLSPGQPTFYYYDDGVFSGESDVPFRRDTAYVLAPVEINADPRVIDMYWLMRQLDRGVHSLSDLGNMGVYWNWPDCGTASEAYLAVLEAAQMIEDDAAELDAAANLVAEHQCDIVDGEGRKLCIDFFIATKTFLLVGEGDNRGFDPNAKYTASRAQLYFDPDHPEAGYTLLLQSSKILLVSQVLGLPYPMKNGIEAPPFRHLPRDVEIDSLPNGDIKVKVSLYNGFCTMAGRDHCPSIDAEFTLTRLANGQFFVGYRGDDYPSSQVNQYINGSWTELARRSEHPGFMGPTFLFEARKKTTEMKNNNRMPPGCLLQ